MTCEVVALGAGPAGLIASIRLAQLGRSVRVLTRQAKEGPRVGESVGPEVREFLASIGLAEGFDAVPAIPFVGASVAWGDPAAYERSAILNPGGAGLHLDREAFDAWLLGKAQSVGVDVDKISEAYQIQKTQSGWRLASAQRSLEFSYLIDARGRGSTSEQPARKWIAFDRLVGVAGWFRHQSLKDDVQDPELLIESVPLGWWYSAMLPGHGLVATLMTDADLLRGVEGKSLTESWRSALEYAPLTRKRLEEVELTSSLQVRRADSGYSWPDHGPSWTAIGDATTARDPLAGTGILRAMQSGFEAAGRVHEHLSGAKIDFEPVASKQLRYLEERARYYGTETRWPNSVFWLRRSNPNLGEFKPFLDPEAALTSSGREVSEQDLARAESLLPYRQLASLIKLLAEPMPAHQIVEFLREQTGALDEKLLLAGVHFLAMSGAIRAV